MRGIAGIVAAAVLFAFASTNVDAAPCAGFTDVDDSDLFCTHVEWVKNRNVAAGCTGTLYCPHDPATRLQMAAFLRRLGDLLLPPNVIWVAPVGGQFQSIQAAIDYAASLPPNPRRLIKVAPGHYSETIVMAPFVDVEGSGQEVTVISGSACGNAPSNAGVVTSTGGQFGGQLRHLSVWLGAGLAFCNGIYLDGTTEVPVRDVRVGVTGAASGSATAIRIAAPPGFNFTRTLERVVVNAAAFLDGVVIGISATGQPASRLVLKDVRIETMADIAATAIQLTDVNARLDGVDATATKVGTPASVTALQVQGATSNVTLERSALRAHPTAPT